MGRDMTMDRSPWLGMSFPDPIPSVGGALGSKKPNEAMAEICLLSGSLQELETVLVDKRVEGGRRRREVIDVSKLACWAQGREHLGLCSLE